jgi:hypothetical protein
LWRSQQNEHDSPVQALKLAHRPKGLHRTLTSIQRTGSLSLIVESDDGRFGIGPHDDASPFETCSFAEAVAGGCAIRGSARSPKVLISRSVPIRIWVLACFNPLWPNLNFGVAQFADVDAM